MKTIGHRQWKLIYQLEIVLCKARELSFSKPAENWESASQVSVQKNLEGSWVALKFCRFVRRMMQFKSTGK